MEYAKTSARSGKKDDFIWSALLHWGMKMWGGEKYPRLPHPKDHLLLEYPVWRDLTKQMSAIGMNMVVVDIGEGIEFKSHPELAVRGTWKQERFRDEVKRLKDLGLEPVPKLNFSAVHDDWLDKYQLMLSTPKYYQVCADCINEMFDLFEAPRYFHFVDLVEKRGARAISWVPSEDGDDPASWISRARKSVLMNTAYYGRTWNRDDLDVGYVRQGLEGMTLLDRLGYDQIVCGTTWVPGYYRDRNILSNDVNFPLNVVRAKEMISKAHLKGFMMTMMMETEFQIRKTIA